MTYKDSSTHGWLVVKRDEYEKMRQHDHAGPGTPLNPDAPGHWAMTLEPGGTTLWTGVQVVDD